MIFLSALAILFHSFLSLTFSVETPSPGKIESVSGIVAVSRRTGNVRATAEMQLSADDKIIVGQDAKITVSFQGQTLTMSDRGSFRIDPLESELVSFELIHGVIRARISKKLKDAKNGVQVIRTPSATMGVRGTDFFASYDPLLDETEVICFESEISFASSDGKTSAIVKEGHWGGVGGRFGKVIRPPMKLSSDVLDHFKKMF